MLLHNYTLNSTLQCFIHILQFAEDTVQVLDDISDWPADVVEERSSVYVVVITMQREFIPITDCMCEELGILMPHHNIMSILLSCSFRSEVSTSLF